MRSINERSRNLGKAKTLQVSPHAATAFKAKLSSPKLVSVGGVTDPNKLKLKLTIDRKFKEAMINKAVNMDCSSSVTTPATSDTNTFYVEDQPMRRVSGNNPQLVSIAAVAASPTNEVTTRTVPVSTSAIHAITAAAAIVKTEPQTQHTMTVPTTVHSIAEQIVLGGRQQQQKIETTTTTTVATADELCSLITASEATSHAVAEDDDGLPRNHNNNNLDLPPVGKAADLDLDLKVMKTETGSSNNSNSSMAPFDRLDGLSELLMANGSTGDLNLDALDPIDTWESGSSSSGGSVGSHFEFACTQDEVSDMLSDIGVSETDWVDNLIAI